MNSSDIADQTLSTQLLGPVLVGDCVQLMLYGAVISAFISFCTTSGWASSSATMRWIVCVTLGLETLVTGLQCADLFAYGVLQDRTVGSLLTGTLMETTEPLFVGLIGAIVEGALVVRAMKLIEDVRLKWVFLVVAGATAVLGLLGSVGATAWSLIYYDDPFSTDTWPLGYNTCVAIWLWSAAGTDTIITLTLIFVLRKRVANYNKSPSSIVYVVVKLAIQSYLYTSVMALAGALLSTIFNGNSLETTDLTYAFWLPLPGLYTLSLFVALSTPYHIERVRDASSVPLSLGRIDLRISGVKVQTESCVKVELEDDAASWMGHEVEVHDREPDLSTPPGMMTASQTYLCP